MPRSCIFHTAAINNPTFCFNYNCWQMWCCFTHTFRPITALLSFFLVRTECGSENKWLRTIRLRSSWPGWVGWESGLWLVQGDILLVQIWQLVIYAILVCRKIRCYVIDIKLLYQNNQLLFMVDAIINFKIYYTTVVLFCAATCKLVQRASAPRWFHSPLSSSSQFFCDVQKTTHGPLHQLASDHYFATPRSV